MDTISNTFSVNNRHFSRKEKLFGEDISKLNMFCLIEIIEKYILKENHTIAQ